MNEGNSRIKRRYEGALIGFLDQPARPASAYATAIFIIGEVKSQRAIPALVNQLETHYISELDDMVFQQANPVDALLKIGKPSLLPLLKSCTRYTAPHSRQLIGNMYYLVCGSKDQALAYLHAHTPKRLRSEAQDIAFWINQVNN